MKSTHRTLDLFETYAERAEPLTLSEVARLVKIPVSTCFNMMRALQERGYLYEVGGRKTFYPTARWLEKARTITDHDPFRKQLQPHLEALRDQTGETVLLGKRVGDRVVYLAVVHGTQSIRYSAGVGDIKPLHCSGIGKALLGALPEAEREKVVSRLKLTKVTSATITQRKQLLTDIAEATQRGWFVSHGENVADVMAIAKSVNIRDDVYAVAVAGPLQRLETSIQTHARALVASCKSMVG
jgi:DNA-binding IclR family transcriptional regulator